MSINTPRPIKKPITFGRRSGARVAAVPTPLFSDDFRLFLMTFVGGFLFTALFIA